MGAIKYKYYSMLRFKKFLIEDVVRRNSIETTFSPENNPFFNSNTGTFDFSVYHAGSHDLSVPGSIQTLSTIPKPEKAAELWGSQVGSGRTRTGFVGRDIIADRLRTYSKEGRWVDAQTPSKLGTTTVGFHTTPDPVGARDYRVTDYNPNEYGMKEGSRVSSFNVSLKPEEIQHFDNMDAYEEHIRNLRKERTPGDWRIGGDDNLRAARDFRARGIKGISIKQGTGPLSVQKSGEFIILDPSIIKYSKDASKDAFDTMLDTTRNEIQQRVNETGRPQIYRGEEIKPISSESPQTKISTLRNIGAGGLAVASAVAGGVLSQGAEAATTVMGGMLTPPAPKERMQGEKTYNSDVGVAFDLSPEGELVASPEGMKAVRERQAKGINFPTVYPRDTYK